MMTYLLSPAVQRALDEAARWRCSSDCNTTLPQVLLGLLTEAECRAAEMLRQRGIDSAVVLQRWDGLQRAEETTAAGHPSLESTVRRLLRAADELLFDFPRPLAIATEHLLLGAVALDDPVSAWLNEQGLSAEEIAKQIRRLHGLELVETLPIEIDAAQTAGGAATTTAPATESPDRDRSSSVTSWTNEPGLLRLLDASANRAREGLRVVEEYVRFVLNDQFLTAQLKELRHALAGTLAALAAGALHAARDTERDVGTRLTTRQEQQRSDPEQVAAASFKRVQEALRSLEEFGKILSPQLAEQFKQLRYRAYTLERATAITMNSLQRLASAQLYVLLDGRENERQFRRLAMSLIEAGVDMIQLRDKSLADRELLQRARLLRDLTRDTQTLLIVNDRPDLARLCRADGVHVGQEELSARDARAIVGTGPLVGVSTHSLAQARASVMAGANYIGVGPTFPSGTKEFERFTGVELLAQVAGEIRLPAFAIGGITLDNLSAVLAAGFCRVAVSSAIVNADHPALAAGEFLARLRVSRERI
jgi:thiamine-phosphate pyrophosphorylase